jgi:hypothetical protein
LNGIGSGIAETAQGTVIADIFFLHSRGKWNTLFWVANMGALMVRPMAFQTPFQYFRFKVGAACPRYIWAYVYAFWMAKLLVAHGRHDWTRPSHGYLLVPRNYVESIAPVIRQRQSHRLKNRSR